MKLLIFTTYYPPEFAAAGIRVAKMVEQFSYKDDTSIKVIVFNPLYKHRHRFECNKENNHENLQIIRYTRGILPSFIFLPQNLNCITLISWMYISFKEIIKYKPDIVISATPFAPVSASGIISKILRIPYVVDFQDDLIKYINDIADRKKFYIKYPLKFVTWFASIHLYYILRNASLISTVNKELQENLLKINKNVILIPLGIDIQKINRIKKGFNKEKVLDKNNLPYSSKTTLIGYIGDLNIPYHLPEMLLKPLRCAIDKGYNFMYIIIGEGKYIESINIIVQNLNLENHVFLVGQKQNPDALELLLACDIAFYSIEKKNPQSNHAISTKIYEYIGCELPILAISDEYSALSRFINKHGIGISLNHDELNKIEKSLIELTESEEYKKNLISHYENFIKEFDKDKLMDKLYDHIVAVHNSHDN